MWPPCGRARVKQFENRRAALAGEHSVIGEKVRQLESQITGAEQQAAANQQQRDSVQKELDLVQPLAEKGLITQPRLLQLQRNSFALNGQIEFLHPQSPRCAKALPNRRRGEPIDSEVAGERGKAIA